MKPTAKYTLTGSLLVLAGAIWLCFFSYKNNEVIEYLSIASVGFGWYFISYKLISYYFLKLKNFNKTSRPQSKGLRQALHVSYFVLFLGSLSLFSDLSHDRVSYALSHHLSKTTTARVTDVEHEFTLLGSGGAYERVTFKYVNNGDSVEQGITVSEKKFATAYWVGRPLLIKFSVAHPDMFLIVKRL
jgi:hypothetical protein